MALNKDVLGLALYNNTAKFNNVNIDPAEMEAKRLEQWKEVANTVINHFKLNGIIAVNVNTVGTAAAQAGTGTGTIS